MPTPTWLHAFVDDASALRGNVHEATAAGPGSAVIGPLLVRDTELPLLRGYAGPVACVVTGGAGQVAGPSALCERLGLSLQRLELTARDPADPVGSTRRLLTAVDDARATGALVDEVEVRVALPAGPVGAGWLAAADEIAVAGLALTLGGSDVLAQVDAALDRELGFGVSGLTGGEALAVLGATVRLFDGEPASLEHPLPAGEDLQRGRRWFRSFWAPAAVADELLAGAR